MSKLIAIKKRIAALEVEAERLRKDEMTAAITQIREIMAAFGLTFEHLHAAIVRGKRSVDTKAKAKRAGRGVAKFADPKTGKTWSGLGRAPQWIAKVKNRDSFLIDKSSVALPQSVASAPAAKKVLSVKSKSKTKATTQTAKIVAGAIAKKARRKTASATPPATSASLAAPAAPAASAAAKRGAASSRA